MCKPKIGADCWEQPRDNVFSRNRLRRILRALGLNELNGWQRGFVFGTTPMINCMHGKTIACLVRLMMWYRGVIDRSDILCAEILGDPDYYAASAKSRRYYLMEIEQAHAACVEHGIRVFRFKDQRKRWWRP